MRAVRWTRRLRRRLRPRAIKRMAPRSLMGRTLAIIVLPILSMQGAVSWAFFEQHWRTVSDQLSSALAGDVAWDVALYRADPTPAGMAALARRAEEMQSISIAFQSGARLPTRRRASLTPPLDDALRVALDDRLTQAFWVDTTRYPAYVDMRVAVPDGVLRMLAPRDRAFAARGRFFLLWLGGATLILTSVAVLFVMNQVRAIERLAAAADAFGRGVDLRFKPHGAREVRQAGDAFLAMKDRIQRHIDQRTALLASVSHDLRTPLTRLKLETALAEPSPRIAAIGRDVDEMEHMIDEYLAFASGEGGEAIEGVALRPLLDEISADARQIGAETTVDADAATEAPARRRALKRALSNLAMNAAAHATRVRLTAQAHPEGGVEILVDDDGPGIAPDQYEEAFRPFSRLDEARNQNRKGVGLGLAIARDIVRGHGGDVTLSTSPLGGLRAAVRLPGRTPAERPRRV